MNEAQTLAGRSMIFAGGIGFATPDAKTAADALEAGGLNWSVALQDSGTRNPNTGDFIIDHGRKYVVRQDNGALLGNVGRRYHPIQNAEMFEWCDRLVDDFGAKYEAAWSLYGGTEVGLTMVFPDEIMIAGNDPYAKYLLLRARHDGTGSVRAMVTDVRLYCTNMLNVATKGASNTVRIAHRTNATQKLAAARETFEMTFKYQEAFEKEMEALVTKQLTDDAFKAITSELLAGVKFGGLEKHTAAIVDLRTSSPTLPDEHRGSAYGAFQAITEWSDWTRETKSAQGRVTDLLDGRVLRLKNNALAALSV